MAQRPYVSRRLVVLFGAAACALWPAARARADLAEWRRSRAGALMDDFGELARYRDADAALKPPSPGEDRVVFFGDSITDFWDLAKSFPGKPFVNRGISGQTTAQMLLRFRQDVSALRPRAVVILAGTNDIAGNTGPARLEDVEANLASMEELASAAGIRVVFSSVLPVNDYVPRAKESFALRPLAKIAELDRWLKGYCERRSCVYLDYAAAMTDAKGYLRRELSDDGLHPNAAGYAVMVPLAQAAIDRALR
jgi:lysophospholipase L1-like esterase